MMLEFHQKKLFEALLNSDESPCADPEPASLAVIV